MAGKKLLSLLFLSVPLFVSGQTMNHDVPVPASPLLSLQLSPALDIPLGESASYFGMGGQLGLRLGYHLPFLPQFSVVGELAYGFDPLISVTSISRFQAGGGAGIFFGITEWLAVSAYLTGGYYFGLLNDPANPTGGGDPYLAGGAGVAVRVLPTLTLDVGAAYTNCFRLYSAIAPFVGATFSLGGESAASVLWPAPARASPLREEAISVESVTFRDVFPVFYKYYDDHPIGSVTFHNKGAVPLTSVRVSTDVGKFMDTPKECAVIESLAPGESRTVGLFALFNDKVLEITESTKIAAEVVFDYSIEKRAAQQKKVETIRLQDRNAMTWGDDRRAAAFVSLKDPAVLSFSKNVISMVKGKGSKAVNQNLLTAMACHEALTVYGLQYVVDPKTPHAELAANEKAIDFLQFPRQTLDYRAGDCDDLSILYCALLQAVGIETAFITIPGHIFMAFSLEIDPGQARKAFPQEEDLIFQGEKTWVPIEITIRSGGFLRAWQEGAKEWRQNAASKQAAFYPLQEAWKTYEPVGLPDVAAAVALPPADKVVAAYLQEAQRFIDREIFPMETKIRAEIQAQGETPARLNLLGILYAKFGQYDRAERELKNATAKEEYGPALANLGNVCFLQGNKDAALDYYERASRLTPDDPVVLLGLARVNYALENYGQTARSFARLKQADPGLALRFSYLGLRSEEAARSADQARAEGVAVWSGDE
jgi:tetratricopeptide (TPR) repeat protein